MKLNIIPDANSRLIYMVQFMANQLAESIVKGAAAEGEQRRDWMAISVVQSANLKCTFLIINGSERYMSPKDLIDWAMGLNRPEGVIIS